MVAREVERISYPHFSQQTLEEFHMAQDIFLKLDKIEGESADKSHGKEIDIQSWSWGISNSGSMSQGGGGGVGKASFSELHFTHTYDKASPILEQKCATLEHIASGVLTCRKAGKTQLEYLVIKLTDVIVTSVQPSSSSGDGTTTESVSLQFTKVEVNYKPQKADGSLDAAVTFKYDIKANAEG